MPARLFFLAILLSAVPVLATSPASFEQISKQAEAAQKADHLPDAIRLYQQGLRLKPTWTAGWWSLGSIFYDQDRYPEAQHAFHRFVALSPKPGPGYAFLALCEYEARDYERALQHFRMWGSKGWAGTSQLIDVGVFHFALLLTREGQFVPALYLLAGEAQRSHRAPALIEAIGLASLRMKNVPEDYPPEQREAVWLAGKSAFYASVPPTDFQQADDYAHRLATHYNQTPNVHYFLGTLRRFESNDAEAAKEFERELQIAPKHAASMIELARLAKDQNELDKGLSLAKTAAELEPDDPEVHQVYGELLLQKGSFEASVRELESAKKLAPDSAKVRFQLAAAYRKLKRPQDAQRETTAFNLLKDKQQVMASPQEKLASHPELLK